MYPVGSFGTPPVLMMIPKMINPIQVMILMMASTNSTAAKIISLYTDELKGRKWLTLSITSNSKNLNDDQDNQEDTDEDGRTQAGIPVLDCETGSSDLERSEAARLLRQRQKRAWGRGWHTG